MSTSGDGEEEILVRISKASQAFASFKMGDVGSLLLVLELDDDFHDERRSH